MCKILNEQEVKPHKVRYYLERRDPEFKAKMAEVLCVYREVKIIKETAAASKKEPSDAVAIVSYDEKPGIQAIATTAPDLPPEPSEHATFARDHEYKRLGTVSLLAGIDLLTGAVHALVKDRHRSREFIEFLKLLDAAYLAHTAIKLILDNHSAHISKETKAWLAEQPAGRFEFTFTPKHGSWLNLVEGFFSKLARSVLRHIQVASKQELKERIIAAMDEFDDEAAKIREYNNKFLGEGVDAYINVEAAPPAQKPAGRDHRGPTAVSVATLGARLGLARPGDPAATRATTTDRAENHVRRMRQSLRTHEHAAGLGAPGRAPSTKGSSRRIRLVFAPTWRSAPSRFDQPADALFRMPCQRRQSLWRPHV